MNEKPKTLITLIVLKRSHNSLEQERLRQSRIKFNLACMLIAVSAAFCFTGVGLFWSGNIPKDMAAQTVNWLLRVATMSVKLIEGKQGRQLERKE
jgi:dipeptide/tripeptide permease